jgi:hypothetical protein
MDQSGATVSRFNRFINARDIEGLSAMMTDDHTFIDAANQQIVGKLACVRAWQGFFAAFPDYRNHFEHVPAGERGLLLSQGARRVQMPVWMALPYGQPKCATSMYRSGGSLRTMCRIGERLDFRMQAATSSQPECKSGRKRRG